MDCAPAHGQYRAGAAPLSRKARLSTDVCGSGGEHRRACKLQLTLAPAIESGGVNLPEQALHAAVPTELERVSPSSVAHCFMIAAQNVANVGRHRFGVADRTQPPHGV